jgi:branched-chain amino acid transport system permease protein
VSAEAFTILLSIQFLAMVIIGGLGSVASSVLGTAFILLLPQVMQAGASTLADFFPPCSRASPTSRRCRSAPRSCCS